MKHIRTEVIELGSTAVVMSSWGIRNQALKSLEELATHLDASFLHYYTKILDGKYFNGKESIVKGNIIISVYDYNQHHYRNGCPWLPGGRSGQAEYL